MIELLIAIAVIATLALGVSLAASRPAAPRDLQRFADAWQTQRDLAALGRMTRGLRIEGRSVIPVILKDGEWQKAGAPIAFAARASLAPSPPPGRPEVVFVATGESTPFVLLLKEGRCESDGAVLSC